MREALDFTRINQAALASFPAVLNRLLPRGKTVGRELVALNPRRPDRNLGSFKVNQINGRWADFATGENGRRSRFIGRLSRERFPRRGGALARPNARPGYRGAARWITRQNTLL